MKCLAGKISSSSLLSTYSPVSRFTTLIASIVIAEELDAVHELLVDGDELEHVAAYAKRAAHEVDVVATVLHVDELAQKHVAIDLVADADARRHLHVVGGRAQAVDARDRGDDQRVGTRKQRLRRGVAQALDLVVDRLNPFRCRCRLWRRTLRADSNRSTKRNTRPRCSGKNSRNSAHSCAASVLLWQSTSVGFCTSSMTRAIASVLPLPVTPKSVCARSPRRSPSRQRLGRRRLVAGQRIGRHELKSLFCHGRIF